MMAEKVEKLASPEALKTYDLSFLEGAAFGGWSIEKDACRFIGKVCETLRPRRVLEFGTGLSTRVLAHEAAKGNVEKIWSVDHLADFPGHPRDMLAPGKGREQVNFRRFPIKLTFLAGKIFQFYSVPKDFFNETGELNLVIIDGPPYYYNSREAALYMVYPHLSDSSLVLLDDANRINREQLYLNNWKRYFGSNIESMLFLDDFKKGLACIWPTGLKKEISPLAFSERFKDSCDSLRCEGLSILRKIKR